MHVLGFANKEAVAGQLNSGQLNDVSVAVTMEIASRLLTPKNKLNKKQKMG